MRTTLTPALERLPLLVLLALLLAPNSAAQGGQKATSSAPLIQDNTNRTIEWPTGPGWDIGDFGQPSAGDLDGDGSLDVLVLRNGAVHMFYSPYSMNAVVELPTSGGVVTAMTCLTRQWSGSDAVLISDGRGLVLHTFNPVLGDFDAGSVLNASAAFQSARALRVVDLGNGADLLVLSGDGLQVSAVLADAGAYNMGFSFSTDAEASDMAGYDLLADGVREVALVQETGVGIYDQAGVLQLSIPSILAGGQLAVVRSSDYPGGEQLVFVTPSATPGRWNLITHTSAGLEAPLALTAYVGANSAEDLDFVGLAVGDYTQDGSDDLAIMHRNSRHVLLLPNQSSGDPLAPSVAHYSLGVGEHYLAPFGTNPDLNASSNDGTPLFADFSGDGLLDLGHALDTTVPGTGPARLELITQLDGAPAYFEQGYELVQPETKYKSENPFDPQSELGSIQLAFLVPDEIFEAFNQVRIITWVQDDENGFVTPQAHSNYLFDLDKTKLNGLYQNNQYAELEIPYMDTIWPVGQRHHVYFQIRFTGSVNGQAGENAPLLTAGFTLRSGTTLLPSDYAYLESQERAGPAVFIQGGDLGASSQSFAGEDWGALNPAIPIPKVPAGQPPTRPASIAKGSLLLTPVY